MTLSQLYDELERHDWFYYMSDSDDVYQRGKANAERLHTEADAILGGYKLLLEWKSYIASNSPFSSGLPKPKPARPQ